MLARARWFPQHLLVLTILSSSSRLGVIIVVVIVYDVFVCTFKLNTFVLAGCKIKYFSLFSHRQTYIEERLIHLKHKYAHTTAAYLSPEQQQQPSVVIPNGW